jgi:hypothetical protein
VTHVGFFFQTFGQFYTIVFSQKSKSAKHKKSSYVIGLFHQVQARFVTASLFTSVNWHHLLSFTVTSELASEYLPVRGTH